MIVITNIERTNGWPTNEGYPNNKFDSSGYSKFCIDTWKTYCDNLGIPLKILTEDKYIHPHFSYLSVFDEVHVDKVIVVDVDTMINPNTPNLLKLFDGTLTVVRDSGRLDGIIPKRMSINVNDFDSKFQYQIDKTKFFNTGVMMFHRNHENFLNKCKRWVHKNYEKISKWTKESKTRLDQIPFNHFVQKNNISLNFLDSRYNRTGLLRDGLNPLDNYIIHFKGPKPPPKITNMKNIYRKTNW